MGTRSLTIIKEPDGTELCVIYRQYDGYIEGGHGEDLAKFLADMRLVNGYTSDDKAGKAANGIGCLAAQLVATLKLKEGEIRIGNIYLYPPGTRDAGEDFVYTLSEGKQLKDHAHAVNIKVESGDEVIFDGTANKFLAYIAKEKATPATP